MTLLWATSVLLASCADDPSAERQALIDAVEVPEARMGDEAAIESGRALYQEHCVLCHGVKADGHGLRRAALDPPPRDYTDPAWRERATPSSVFVAIRHGVPSTAMPAWSVLSEDECWDLAAYVLSVSEEGP